MAFDFGALLQNPAFQFGTTLLGSARQPGAIGNAFSSIQKLQEYKQQQELQKAQIENMQAQRRAEEERARIAQGQLDRQNDIAERVAVAEERKQQIQDAFMKQLQGLGIMGGAPPQQQQMPAPQQDPQSSITPQLMDSLAQVESSGNPTAINPQSGAQGMYQFMPATTRMIQQRNPQFDPMNPQMARTAAQQYLQTLTAQHGGSLERALAAYGGFKKKDPTAYIQKVMAGAGMQPQQPQAAAGSPVPVAGGMANQGLDIARLGVGAGVAGVPGAAQIMELAKIMAPQNVTAGSYQRTSDGQMQYVPDPKEAVRNEQEAARIALEQQRTANDTARANATIDEKNQKVVTAKEGAISGFREVTDSMDNLSKAAKELLAMPGLPSTTGLSGVAKIYNLTQEGRDAAAALETLQSKIAVDQLMKMKALSANGASGFGALSGPELRLLETYQVNLSKATSLPARQKALKDLMDFADLTKARVRDRVKGTYGEEAIKDSASPSPTSSTNEILTPEQYIQKYSKPKH
jgi:soluble lytic murein transglycosylase-like protein